MENTFCKDERLCNEYLFNELMNSDFRFVKYPLRVIAKMSSLPGKYPARTAISVSKRKFKRAVKRNRVKRQVREAFRIHKSILNNNCTIDIIFIYLDDKLNESSKIEKSVVFALEKITSHFSQPASL